MNAATLSCGITARSSADIQLQIASTREEREAVFQLVYQAYRGSGLCQPNASELRFTSYQLLPTTDLLFAQLHEEVICTLSLVRDGELGLPIDNIYAEQVEERRAAGLRLAEVSSLADRRNEPARFFEIFCELSRLMIQLAEKQSVDQLLITVHPRHAPMYMRYMAFQRIGERRNYSSVNGNPAVPLCLDLHKIQANRPPCWEKFFGEKIPGHLLKARPITAEDRDYFLGMEEKRQTMASSGVIESDPCEQNACEPTEALLPAC